MTELAYLPDLPAAYVARFRAHVVALPPGGLALDRTYFYPTGGGQPSDRGVVRLPGGSAEIVDVTKSGATVVHRARGWNPRDWSVGTEVEGEIDWPRRHEHMRLHTAQHLASARVFARTGQRTRRASLKDGAATIDLEAPVPLRLLDDLAADLAAAIESPRPVRIRHVPRAEWDAHPSAPRSGLVPLPPQVDPVRVIEIEGEDACPCGGTHLRSTGEIGPVVFSAPAPGTPELTRVGFRLASRGATVPPE
jgi:misacylated tRNA(Ala) deacylase